MSHSAQHQRTAGSAQKSELLSMSQSTIQDILDEEDSDVEDGVGQTHSRRAVNEDDDDRMKAFKTATMQRLLAEFDLEATLKAYKSTGGVMRYSRNPMDYSHDVSLKVAQLNKKLRRLMGTDVVSVNDPSYTSKLRERYWREYEEELDRKEEARAEAERNRMRRLMREGIITYDELMQDQCIFKDRDREREYHESSKLKGKRRKSANSKRSKSAVKKNNESDVHKLNTHIPEDQPCASAPSSRAFSAAPSHMKPRAQSAQYHTSWSHERAEEDTNSSNNELYVPMATGRKCHSAPPERQSAFISKRYEHPLVRKMRDEETVEGLYSIAEELVHVPDDVNKDLKEMLERKSQVEVIKPIRKTMFNHRYARR